jgi:hypothetical protein
VRHKADDVIGISDQPPSAVAVADKQAAMLRVATLVAQDAAPAEIFAAVSAEVDRAFGLDPATFDVAVVGRFEPGPELVVVGVSKSVEAQRYVSSAASTTTVWSVCGAERSQLVATDRK